MLFQPFEYQGTYVLQNARAIVESKSERNRKIQIRKGVRPFEMLDVLDKINQNLRLQFRYQRCTYTAYTFCVLSATTAASLAIKWESRKKLEKVLKILKCTSVFYFLRPNLHLYNLFRAIYRSSSPDAFTKKGVLLQVRRIFTEEYLCGTFAWRFSC